MLWRVAKGLVMMLVLTTGYAAHAQIETLIMPGEVIKGHADIEAECRNCHQRFERERQSGLCLDCHEAVALDIDAGAGFHGRDGQASTAACSSCHTDHEGRDADIVGLVEAAFNHDLTDFELRGGHSEADCVDCHAPDTKHRDAPTDCYGCHEADNPHGETLGTLCGDCHVVTDWLDVEFDHDATGYPLIGLHRDAACLDCHDDETFTNTPTTCIGCHAEDDVHNGLSGDDCGSCHSPRGWDDTTFDHDRDTRFMLEGGHAGVACSGCHSDKPFSDNLSRECISCHLDDDEHDGHYGKACDTCHGTSEWPAVHFDHDIDTHYPLNGAHEDAQCIACHLEPIFEVALEQDCLSCHLDDDVHEGTQGIVCADCHNERAWDDDVFFDHGLTVFPLLGRHAATDCEGCHETHVFTDAPTDCIDCHREDDSHEGRFGGDCGACHNPVDWQQWLFDHDAQTDFPLLGAHIETRCESCHRGSLEAQSRLGQQCIDCHRTDDVHDGEFGPDCGRCHSADSFTDVRTLQ